MFGDGADVLLYGYFGILFDESLVHEAVRLVKFVQHALKNFFNGLRRLAFQAIRLGGNFTFFSDHVGRYLLARNGIRMTRRDLESDVFHELFEFLVGHG